MRSDLNGLIGRARKLFQTTLAASSHEQWFIVLIAGLVGLYAGIAAGLFSGAIHFVNLVLFHMSALVRALRGDPSWAAAFHSELVQTHWNLTFLFVGLLAIAASLGLDRAVSKSERLEMLGPAARRFRLLAVLLAVGILLYYPLIALRAFNQSFALNDSPTLWRGTLWPVILLAPALGCWASVLIVRRFTPKHLGHGVTEVMESVVREGARIGYRVPFWKGIAAAVCTGAGGSVGREGPMVQIGSGLGSAIGQRLGFSRPNLTVLVGSGAAAGIAASFNAPIAGAMFALEIVLGEFGVRTFTPIVFASVMGTMTARSLLTTSAEVSHASYTLVSPIEILPYAVLGLLCGLLSIAYMVAMETSERVLGGHEEGRLGQWLRRLSPASRAALGGLGVGLLGLASPRLLGTGYESMNGALRGELPGVLLAGICLGKIVATPLTLGSGAQGGSFFPATFIGATGGGAFGAFLHWLWPAHSGFRGAYALVGMGAVAAGATQGPLTGIVMMFELTGDYEIILPLMVSCILATSLVQLVMGGSLYSRKLKERGIILRGGHDMGLMRALTVRQAMRENVQCLSQATPLMELLKLMSTSAQPAFPLLDGGGNLSGVVSLTDLRGVLGEADALRNVARAADLSSSPVVIAFPDEDLEVTLQRIETRDLEALVVVERADRHRVLGLVTRRDILAAYEQAVRKAGILAA